MSAQTKKSNVEFYYNFGYTISKMPKHANTEKTEENKGVQNPWESLLLPTPRPLSRTIPLFLVTTRMQPCGVVATPWAGWYRNCLRPDGLRKCRQTDGYLWQTLCLRKRLPGKTNTKLHVSWLCFRLESKIAKHLRTDWKASIEYVLEAVHTRILNSLPTSNPHGVC